MSLLRTMTPKGGVLGTMGTSAFIVLIVNSAVTAYYSPYVSPYSPYSTSQRIIHPDTRYDRVKIEGNQVEHWRHNEGDLAVMKCVTNLNDYPVIVWTKDGRPVPRGMRVYEFINRGNSFLEVPRMSLRDEGNYTCAVSHEFGYAKKMFRVCIIKPGVKEDCPRWWYNWNY